ncbi:hypothetical protein Dred_2578 [Desulforamulus reducens MI-1]|uniref:Uncharacterized protein n=1 Tax=Desulforamulus reducens (strain ATCC BAA-1160 / DSM 100696 / MI-1) TaxID=349161 RepID=A4J7N5_DESRM|nr:hypothetical protein [Desulforamulus reducens]ABO51088.1 hypothetical protein Dred_2578 [Desulforamulus reducens MI-1]
MQYLTQQGLVDLLLKTREEIQKENLVPPSFLGKEEQELLKMVIPMQLGEESASKMMVLVNEIREGKRPPLTEQDRIKLNQQNMEESLINFLTKLSTANEEELATALEMCETIRASRSAN